MLFVCVAYKTTEVWDISILFIFYFDRKVGNKSEKWKPVERDYGLESKKNYVHNYNQNSNLWVLDFFLLVAILLLKESNH